MTLKVKLLWTRRLYLDGREDDPGGGWGEADEDQQEVEPGRPVQLRGPVRRAEVGGEGAGRYQAVQAAALPHPLNTI